MSEESTLDAFVSDDGSEGGVTESDEKAPDVTGEPSRSDSRGEVPSEAGRPEGACVGFDRCGSVVPHGGQICADCLDEARSSDRRAAYGYYPDWLGEKLDGV